MKKRVIPAVCAVLGLLGTGVSAEGPASGYGIEFDFNQDGVTDQSDWNQLSDWVKTYKMSDENGAYFAEQEAPATINVLLDEWYGNRKAADYGIRTADTPEYYLPAIGGSTGIKDQNPFGTCWAFGTISSLESNLLLRRSGNLGKINPNGSEFSLSAADNSVDLSELYLAIKNERLAEEGSQSGEGTAPLSQDINAELGVGAFSSSSQFLLTAWDGPLTEAQEPYEPASADEYGANVYDLRDAAADKASDPAAHVQTFVYMNGPVEINADLDRKTYTVRNVDDRAVDQLKQALVKYGALMMSYKADLSMPDDSSNGEYMNYKHWAQYDDRMDVGMNHMTSIVGWNDNYPKENFQAENNSLPEKDGAWLVKNSWGNYETNRAMFGETLDELFEEYKGTVYEQDLKVTYSYGIPDENGRGTGYFWISYYDHSILSFSAVDADDASDGFDYDHLYQYDLARQVSFAPISLPTDNTETKTANVFTAAGKETLKAVSAYAPYGDCTVNLEIRLLSDTDDPSKGTVLLETTEHLAERGFHTIPLEQPIGLNAGDRFAIIENVTTDHDGKTISWLNLETCINKDLQTPDNINKQTMNVISNPGETYVYAGTGTDGAWMPLETLNSEADASKVFTFGNAYIKAYTTEGTADTPAASAVPSASAMPSASAAPAVPAAAGNPSPLTAALIIGIAAAAYVLFIIWQTK